MSQRTIEIPISVFASAETLADLEDWLSATDPEFINQIKQIRVNEDLKGQGKDLSEILSRWPIESFFKI